MKNVKFFEDEKKIKELLVKNGAKINLFTKVTNATKKKFYQGLKNIGEYIETGINDRVDRREGWNNMNRNK
jgi:hypothetical protein